MTRTPHAWTTDRNSYIEAAIDAEIARLRETVSGRACATFRAAAAIGGFVGAGVFGRGNAERLLLTAAEQTGLPIREASAHIKRGLDCGQRTPRALDGILVPSRPHQQPRATGEHPRYPSVSEVVSLWRAARTVGSDAEAVSWFLRRYGEHGGSLLALTVDWDLARVVPRNMDLPRWAWSRGGPWHKTGHRLLFRLWDNSGTAASVRARSLDITAMPKSLAPAGFSIRGLVLADPLGVQLLTGIVPDWWDPPQVIVAEGEPDWLTWAARQSTWREQGPACFGIEAGSWSQDIADRIPDRSSVVVRTHHDEPGERYAEQVASTLRGRCQLFRSLPEEGAPA